jgi:hypothetical protein
MAQQPMFVITKSGLTIRPEGIDLSIVYTKYFIQDARAKLDEYIMVLPCTSFDDPIFAKAQQEICRAVDIMRELEEVRGHILRVYDRNFQDWAEVFRQTRLELGLERIEDSPELYAAVKRTMAMLKAENRLFSEEKFRKFINNPEASL